MSLSTLGLQRRLANAQTQNCIGLERVRRLFEDDLSLRVSPI